MNKIKIGIIGGAGYTGGELLRLLVHHPNADIVFVNSISHTDKKITEVHPDLIGDTDLVFSNKDIIDGIDVLFLCVGHGEAKKNLSQLRYSSTLKIIDLSQDHRLQPSNFVYGLPELNKESIKKAQFIANPGCFATCIELGLLPLAPLNKLNNSIHISATTGSSGAGQAFSTSTHFTWRHNNLSIYKAFEHQHLAEIGQSLNQLQPNFKSELNFIPYKGGFTRGIFASMYTACEVSIEEIEHQYEHYYKEHPFVHISKSPVDLKQVVNTNKCVLHLEKHGDQLLITSCIDNLLKGASGQAVQNMNLMFGLEETAGLKLKSITY